MASILKNTSTLFLAHLIGRLLAFGLLILLPRAFAEAQIGAYLWSVAITNIMAIIIVFGMHVPLIREIAIDRSRAPRYVGNAFLLRVAFSAIAFALLMGGMTLWGIPAETRGYVLLLALAEILNGWALLFRCVFRAYEEMHWEALIVLFERGFVFAVGGGVVLLGYELWHFCMVVLLASALNLVASLTVVAWRFVWPSFRYDRKLCRSLIEQSFPFALGGIFNILYFRLDTVILPRLAPEGSTAVAWYGLAYSLVTALTILPGAFTNALFPVISRLFTTDREGFRRLYTHAVKLMWFAALPMALGIAMLSQQIVALLWDASRYPFGTIDAALRPLSWAGGIMFLNSVVMIVLRATDRRAAFVGLIAGGLVVDVLLNVLLVPHWSHRGAAFAMLVTEASMLLVGLTYLHRHLVRLVEVRFLLKGTLAGAAMASLLVPLRTRVSLVLLVPLASLVYLGILAIGGEAHPRALRVTPEPPTSKRRES